MPSVRIKYECHLGVGLTSCHEDIPLLSARACLGCSLGKYSARCQRYYCHPVTWVEHGPCCVALVPAYAWSHVRRRRICCQPAFLLHPGSSWRTVCPLLVRRCFQPSGLRSLPSPVPLPQRPSSHPTPSSPLPLRQPLSSFLLRLRRPYGRRLLCRTL